MPDPEAPQVQAPQAPQTPAFRRPQVSTPKPLEVDGDRADNWKIWKQRWETTAQSPASSINLGIISVLCSSTASESMRCESTTD